MVYGSCYELGRIHASVGGCEYILISYPWPMVLSNSSVHDHMCVFISAYKTSKNI